MTIIFRYFRIGNFASEVLDGFVIRHVMVASYTIGDKLDNSIRNIYTVQRNRFYYKVNKMLYMPKLRILIGGCHG